jgi:hypothetical protein
LGWECKEDKQSGITPSLLTLTPFEFIKGYATFSSILCHFFISKSHPIFISHNFFKKNIFSIKGTVHTQHCKIYIFSIKGMVHTQHCRNEVKNFLISICTHGIIMPQVLFCLFVCFFTWHKWHSGILFSFSRRQLLHC